MPDTDDEEQARTIPADLLLYNNQHGRGRRQGAYNPDLVRFMSSNFDRAGYPQTTASV